MERREKPRLKVTQPVNLLPFNAQRRHLVEVCVLDISDSGVQLRSPTPIACDTQVSIEREDVLGTVCSCEAHEGAYNVGIQLSDPLSSLIELELLNRALIGEGQVKVDSSSELREKKSRVSQIKK